MKYLNMLKSLSLMAAVSMIQSDAFGTPKGSNSPSKPKEDLGRNFEKKKQGMKKFRFEETGFTCEALNEKSAIKKHEAWRRKKLL